MKRTRRARTLRIPGVHNQDQLIGYLMQRDEGICGLCGEPVTHRYGKYGASVDHIVPLSKGGEHAEHNIQLTHTVCNNMKGNSTDGNGTS